MNDMLKDVFEYGTAAKARGLGFERAFAGQGNGNDEQLSRGVGSSAIRPRHPSLGGSVSTMGTPFASRGAKHCVRADRTQERARAVSCRSRTGSRPEDVVDREIDPGERLAATPFAQRPKERDLVAGTLNRARSFRCAGKRRARNSVRARRCPAAIEYRQCGRSDVAEQNAAVQQPPPRDRPRSAGA